MLRETISVAPWCRSAKVMSEEMSSGWSCISPCMASSQTAVPVCVRTLLTYYQLPHRQGQGQPAPGCHVAGATRLTGRSAVAVRIVARQGRARERRAMALLLGILARQHLLALIRRQPGLVDGDLVGAGMRDAEVRGAAVEPVSVDRALRHADAIELAPGEHLDGAPLPGRGVLLQHLDVALVDGAALHLGDDLVERRRGRRCRGRRRRL